MNSHKEFVESVVLFCKKNESIENGEYLTNINNFEKRIKEIEHRSLLFRLGRVIFDEDYNMILTYDMVLIDKVMDVTTDVLQSESMSLFLASALEDFINNIMQGDMDIEQLEMTSVEENTGVTSVLKFTANYYIKRSPSYWREMEKYKA